MGPKGPADVIGLLWQRLGTSRDEVSFTKVGNQIWATLGEDGWVQWRHDHERVAVERLVILEMVRDACEDQPELKLDWFAVSVER